MFKIEMDLDFDSVIGEVHHGDGDRDQPESVSPYRFGDLVVEAVAAQFARQVDADIRSEMRSAIREALMARINERVGAIVDETFEQGIPRTNQYGEVLRDHCTGQDQVVTLRELIVAQVGQHLRVTGNRAGHGQSRFDKTLAETTEAVLAKELAAEVKAAKDEIRKRVRASATAVLADAIMKGVTS